MVPGEPCKVQDGPEPRIGWGHLGFLWVRRSGLAMGGTGQRGGGTCCEQWLYCRVGRRRKGLHPGLGGRSGAGQELQSGQEWLSSRASEAGVVVVVVAGTWGCVTSVHRLPRAGTDMVRRDVVGKSSGPRLRSSKQEAWDKLCLPLSGRGSVQDSACHYLMASP